MIDSKSLLIPFLRIAKEEEIINRLRELNEDDWEVLLATAMQHKLGPILFHILKPYYADSNIPPQCQDLLRKIYFNSASRNMKLYSQLEEVLQKFAREGIPVTLLKGAYMAKYVYDNIALRPMSDIDLLIKQDDLGKVHHLLLNDGYSIIESSFAGELPPYQKKGKVALEVHSHLKVLPNKEYADINKIWTRTNKVVIGEAEALTLCPEDLFLHLCLHNCIQHRFENGLVACIDTKYFLKHFEKEIDWEQLWHQAQEWGIERAVYLMLALTEKIIKLPIPEQIRQALEPDQDSIDALSEAEELIFLQQPHVGRNLALIFSKVGFREKLKIFYDRIFLPKEIIKGDKKYLFYFSRLRSLYHAHRKTFLLGLRGDEQTIKTIETQNRRSSLSKWLTNADKQ